MNSAKPEVRHELNPQQLADEEEVKRRLSQPSPWLLDGLSGDTHSLPSETSPAQELTTEEMQQREDIQARLAERSPWLK